MYGINDPYGALQRQLDQMRSNLQAGPVQAAGQPYTNIIWVQGIEGAKGHQMPSNANVILLDSENEGTFYIRSSDAVGMTSMRTFHFEEIKTPAKPAGEMDLSKYATKDDVRAIILEMIGKKEAAGDDEIISGPCRIQE